MSDKLSIYELEERIGNQAYTRKTIDKSLLQQWLLSQLNAVNTVTTNKDYLKRYNRQVSHMLHTLNCYRGYNNRGWLAFTSIPGWHDIILALQARDDRANNNKSTHYWRLINYLDSVTPGVFYYGDVVGFVATARERRIASRLHNRYYQALGLASKP